MTLCENPQPAFSLSHTHYKFFHAQLKHSRHLSACTHLLIGRFVFGLKEDLCLSPCGSPHKRLPFPGMCVEHTHQVSVHLIELAQTEMQMCDQTCTLAIAHVGEHGSHQVSVVSCLS